MHLASVSAAEEESYPSIKEIEIESNIAEQAMNTKEFLENVEQIGTRTTYTCPECNGSIWQIGKEEPLRFRCHIGHSFTANIFLLEQTQNGENALWSAVRAIKEMVALSRQMAELMKNHNLHKAATEYEDHAKRLDEEVFLIRELILKGFATKRTIAGWLLCRRSDIYCRLKILKPSPS